MNLTFLVMIIIIGIIKSLLNTPNADTYNKKKVINISSNKSYNLMQYNCVIMLREFLKHTSHYLNDDVKEWVFEKSPSRF